MCREAASSSQKLRLIDFPVIRNCDTGLAGQQSQRTFSPFGWYWRNDCDGLFLATESDRDRLSLAHRFQSFREAAFEFPNAHRLHNGLFRLYTCQVVKKSGTKTRCSLNWTSMPPSTSAQEEVQRENSGKMVHVGLFDLPSRMSLERVKS